MTIGEMHIAIQQGVDKINSFQADMLLPEEIDLELNKAQAKFISLKYGAGNKYQKGFEQSQKRIDDLRSLVVETSLQALYKEQLNNTIFVDTVRLPKDYMHLVNSRSKLWINKCIPIEFDETTGADIKYFHVPMSELLGSYSLDSADSIYMTPDISDDSATSMSIWSNTNSLDLPIDEAAFVAELMVGIPGLVDVYWEEYDGLSYPGEFIFSLAGSYKGAAHCIDEELGSVWHLVVDNPNTPTGLSIYDTPLVCEVSDDVYRTPPENDGGKLDATTEFAINKYVQQDDIYTLLQDPFNTTTYEKPLMTVRGSNLDIFTSDIFIIDEVKLTYIKKPAEISLSLRVSCELPDHTHREIVDMAVSSILETISDPRYKTYENEVGKNE